jgi:hypothetical protein
VSIVYITAPSQLHVVSFCTVTNIPCTRTLGSQEIPAASPICIEIDEIYGAGISVPAEDVLAGFRLTTS